MFYVTLQCLSWLIRHTSNPRWEAPSYVCCAILVNPPITPCVKLLKPTNTCTHWHVFTLYQCMYVHNIVIFRDDFGWDGRMIFFSKLQTIFHLHVWTWHQRWQCLSYENTTLPLSTWEDKRKFVSFMTIKSCFDKQQIKQNFCSDINVYIDTLIQYK